MLEWLKRAKLRESETSKQRRYYTKCREYVVVEAKSKYGLGKKYYAIKCLENGNEHLIDKNARSIKGAKAKCEAHAIDVG